MTCRDALDPDVVNALMDGAEARMAFRDPPYNVPMDGQVGNSGKIQHRDSAMASGAMSEAEFTGFPTRACQNLADHSGDRSIHFICIDRRHMSEMLATGYAVYDELKNLIVWAKNNGGMLTIGRS